MTAQYQSASIKKSVRLFLFSYCLSFYRHGVLVLNNFPVAFLGGKKWEILILDGCSFQILLECIDSTYPVNSFKDMVLLWKVITSFFAIWRFVNMLCLHLRCMSTGYAASQWNHLCGNFALREFLLFEVQTVILTFIKKKTFYTK